jgi:hypothetical protein
MAERAGCTPFTVAKLEAGKQEPAWPLVLQLADALGVSTEEFRLRGDEPGPENPRRRGRPRKAGNVPDNAGPADQNTGPVTPHRKAAGTIGEQAAPKGRRK